MWGEWMNALGTDCFSVVKLCLLSSLSLSLSHNNHLSPFFIAGADDADQHTIHQPVPTLSRTLELLSLPAQSRRLDGIKIGVYRQWLEDSQPEVVRRLCYVFCGCSVGGI